LKNNLLLNVRVKSGMDWGFVGMFGRGEIGGNELGEKGGKETLERVEKRVKLKETRERKEKKRVRGRGENIHTKERGKIVRVFFYYVYPFNCFG
jgi:hypothetical protein